MPDAPSAEAPADPAPAGAAADLRPADPGPAGAPRDRARSPGWREVLLLAGAVLVVVFAVEIASAVLPPVREAFRGFPVTIAGLIAGTIGLLLLTTSRRPRR